MTEQPVTIKIDIQLEELPECKKLLRDENSMLIDSSKCNGYLLPIMDVTLEGKTPYLKGWFCPKCKTIYMFRGGNMIEEKLGGENR